MKTVNIKGKEYVEVNERIKYFRSQEKYKDFSLESEIINLDNGIVTIKAIIKNADDRIIATGFAQEKENSSFINKTSFIENCETSAWGRALGNLGIGIDTSIASAEEVQNAQLNQSYKNKNNIDSDFDIIQGLSAINDIENVRKYYSENIKHVINKEAFIAACKKRKEKIGNKEAELIY